jgi:tape measure domain-containing protein
MAESLVKFKVDARDAIRKIRELGNATGRLAKQNLAAKKSFGGLQGVLTKLALVETGRRMTNMAASFKQTQIRLRLLTKEYGENEAAQDLSARAAKKFGLSQTEALSGITDIYGRLRPIGVTLKEIETTYMGFNVATKLAGVSAQQASGAFLQLSQALGSGRLQGDEYRSIAEQLPILTQAIAKEMGKPVGQIKKLASEGKITSEVVINALRKIEQDGGASIAKLMEESPEQQFKNLQNAISDLSVELGEYLIPATVAVTQALTALVRGVQDLPDPVKATAVAFAAVTTAVGIGVPVLWKLFNIYRAFRIFLLRKFIPALGLTKAAFGPIALGLTALTLGIAAAGNAFVQNKRKAEKFNEALKGTSVAAINAQIDLKNLRIDKLEAQMEKATGKAKRGNVRLGKEVKEAREEIEKLNQRLLEIPGELAAEKIIKASEAMGALRDITAQTSAQFQESFAKKMQQYGKTVNDFGGQVGDIVVKSFRGMEDALVQFVQTGKMNFRSFANSIIADMTRIAIRQMIIAPLMNSFSGWLGNTFGPAKGGGFSPPPPMQSGAYGTGIPYDLPAGSFGISGKLATGGPAKRGGSYLVGERGPELFTPNSSGTVTPNNQLGGSTSVVVNVDASGSSVEGDGGQAEQLGSMLAAAVQAEIANQQRPGGLLAGTR